MVISYRKRKSKRNDSSSYRVQMKVVDLCCVSGANVEKTRFLISACVQMKVVDSCCVSSANVEKRLDF
jgi:hypothetical protein